MSAPELFFALPFLLIPILGIVTLFKKRSRQPDEF